MSSSADSSSGASIKAHLAESLVRNAEVSINLGNCIIATTEDKVRLAVLTHLSRMEQRYKWVAPAGVFASLLAALVTADFKDLILSASIWTAVFLLGCIAAGVYSVWAVIRAVRAPSVDDFVGKLRATQVPLGSNPVQTTLPALAAMLVSGEWVLYFNPPSRFKPITFLPDNTVGSGQNDNEHFWRLDGSKLELLKPDGRVHSRFTFDSATCRWEHTNDPDTLSIKGQYILRADSVKQA
jgi:hypothetical protein